MPLNRLIDSGITLATPDIQQTSFSLDALARFTCNTWDEILEAQRGGQFDIIVIGSGMYGAYTATKLFEFGRRMDNPQNAPRILVLESGPFLITEHIQNLTRRSTDLASTVAEDLVEPGQSNAVPFAKHCRCLGGKSLFWGGWSPRFQIEELRKLDAQGERLWPQAVEDYLWQDGWQGGYQHSELEIGAFPVQDFINGPLYNALVQRAQNVLNQQQVAALTAVLEPPIAVQGEGPGSGLFSFDKYSSLPMLLDSVREDNEISGDNTSRHLFVVPYAEVLKLETQRGRVHEVVVALADPLQPRDKQKARVLRLALKASAQVILAGNTINSTRLALNSFPRPAALNTNGELMGRNLMYHVRSNFVWRVKRSALNLPPPDPSLIKTAALHITGRAQTTHQGIGQFHFQFYAAPNMDVPMFPGASKDPERFLYQMIVNIEDLDAIRAAQSGLGNERVAIGIRTVGETFGDRTSPVASNQQVSWMNVSPFGGNGDDIYFENGQPLHIPKAYVHLAVTPADNEVWAAQDRAAFDFMTALTQSGSDADSDADQPTPAAPSAQPELLAQIALQQVPDNDFRREDTASGRYFVGRFGNEVRVLEGTCTHEGCFVDWNGAENRFSCPCHTAHFAADGLNISGPPPAPLHKPEFRLHNGQLEIIRSQGNQAALEFVAGGRDGIGSTYHEAGTLWMGTDYRKSVTDANGRFHHLANAYCVDQSIFPTVGSANPVLTGIALARKTARVLIDRYTSVALTNLEPGFQSLYSGDLAQDGWTIATAGQPHFFDVADQPHPVLGVGIDNHTPALGVLWFSRRMYKDFILKLDWKAYDIAANSGILLRMPQPDTLDDAFYASSIEVQIDEQAYDHNNALYGSPLHKTGAVYALLPAQLGIAKVVQPRASGQATHWNRFEIRLQGEQIEVKLNQQRVCAGQLGNLLPANAPSAGHRKRVEGFIGLQCHTEVVQFRNIRLREL